MTAYADVALKLPSECRVMYAYESTWWEDRSGFSRRARVGAGSREVRTETIAWRNLEHALDIADGALKSAKGPSVPLRLLSPRN